MTGIRFITVNPLVAWFVLSIRINDKKGMMMVKPSKPGDKEKSTHFPDWTHDYPRKPNENCKDYAERILKEKYGECDPRADKRGPGSEYSKIKKACERGGLSS